MANKQKKISEKVTLEALIQSLPIVRAHLDLEGISYVKITRTGADECFSMDVTSKILGQELNKAFWENPACLKKWGKK